MKEINIKIKASNNNFKLMVLGDAHVGDPLSDIDLLKSTINYIKDTPNCYVIVNGDMMNNALKTSKSDIYNESMSMEDQQDFLIELLTPIKNRILFMCSGNHEYRTHLAAGINPLRYVARELGLPKDRFSDYESYLLTLEFGVKWGVSNRPNRYIVYGTHGGSGGGRRPGSTANALEDMNKIISNADLYIHSHTHTPINFSDLIYLYDPARGKVNEHIRTYYNANAFLKHGGYADQKGYKLVDRSPSVLDIRAIRTKSKMRMMTNIIKI